MHFLILSLFLVNGPQALYVKPGYFKSISGINLSQTSKNLFTILIILYLKQNGTIEIEWNFT